MGHHLQNSQEDLATKDEGQEFNQHPLNKLSDFDKLVSLVESPKHLAETQRIGALIDGTQRIVATVEHLQKLAAAGSDATQTLNDIISPDGSVTPALNGFIKLSIESGYMIDFKPRPNSEPLFSKILEKKSLEGISRIEELFGEKVEAPLLEYNTIKNPRAGFNGRNLAGTSFVNLTGLEQTRSRNLSFFGQLSTETL
jgi:hypothetical protein